MKPSHASPRQVASFVANVQKSWESIHAGSAAKANRFIKANDRFAEELREGAALEDALGPLLVHDAAMVRCAAAAYLIRSNLKSSAVEVLRALVDHQSMVGPEAAAVLRVHGIK
jgi:hypothetical protein